MVAAAGMAMVAMSMLGAVPAAQAAAPSGVVGCVGVAPTNLQATAGPFAGEVTLNWDADPACPAADYEVQYRESGLSVWSPSETTGSPWSQYVVTGLSPSTAYVFQVRGFYGSGFSDWSAQSSAITPSVPSGAPTNVRATPSGSFAVTVAWNAPSPPPLSYQVQFRANLMGATWQPRSPYTVRGTSIDVTDLSPGTSYFFQVRAFYGGSNYSDWAATTTAVSPGAAPGAPSSVTATPGNGQLVVSWTPLLGATVTGYQLQYSTDGVNWSPPGPLVSAGTGTTYTITGLTNGIAYFVRVQSVNGPLVSAWATTTSAVAPLGTPGAPTGLAGVPANGQVTLTWTAPASSVAAPVTGYRGQYSTNGGASWTPFTITGTATTTVVTGLTNGTGYVFQVQAFNAAGNSPWSASTPTITPPGVPAAPTNVVAVAGDKSAIVTWLAPAATSSPVIGYRVTASPGGRSCTTSAVPPDVPDTTCEVTGLENGQPYTFTVTASNAYGTSPASSASAPVTPVAKPPKITIVASGRDGGKVYVNGETANIPKGATVTAMVKYTKGGAFEPTGNRKVKGDGSFRWTLTTNSKVWVYFTYGTSSSRTVTISAR